MTKREALKKMQAVKAYMTSGNPIWSVTEMGEAFDMAIEALTSAQPQRWIPVSERLPEESGRYLISVLDGVGKRTTVASYQPRYKAWTMTGRMAYWKVVAWMPLREAYKGDE